MIWCFIEKLIKICYNYTDKSNKRVQCGMSNDKKIKKKLLRYTVFMIIVGTVLIVSAVCIVYTSKKAENNSHVAYVNAILGEYKLNFSNKIESDLSTLVSVADMIEQGYISKDDIIKDVFTYFPKNSSISEE